MGERKGQNKYYPPDFDYRKHKSLDNYHGSHPLRERAKKLSQGILVIRFEMPYNIWCDGCGNHIGMGVRYNAEKSKIGNYYTTPIYKFRMKCHLCPNYMEIKTDPAAHDYVIISGARRKEQRWDPKENEQIVTDDKEMQKKLARDAMYRLEHTAEDKAKKKTSAPAISQLAELRDVHKEDYMLNKLARSKFRTEKKLMQSALSEDDALLKKSSLDIKLVAENEDDVSMAKLFQYRTVTSFDAKQKEKRDEIMKRSIFGSSSTLPSQPGSVSGTQEQKQRLNQLAGQLGIQKKTPSSTFSKVVSKTDSLSQLVRTSQPSATATSSDTDSDKLVEDPAIQGGEYVNPEEPVDLQSSSSAIPNMLKAAQHSALACLGLDYDSSNSGSSEEADNT